VCGVTINKHQSPAEYLTSEKSNNVPKPEHRICAQCTVNFYFHYFKAWINEMLVSGIFREVRQIKTHNSEFIYLFTGRAQIIFQFHKSAMNQSVKNQRHNI
jgi:hypothetical protein